MERRVAVSEKILHEIHAVVLELRPAAAVAADSSAVRRSSTIMAVDDSISMFCEVCRSTSARSSASYVVSNARHIYKK